MRNKWLEKLKCWFSICFAARFPFSLNLKFFLHIFFQNQALHCLFSDTPFPPAALPARFTRALPTEHQWALAELRHLSRRCCSDMFPLVTTIWSSCGRVFNEEGVKAEHEAFWGRLPSVCSSAWKSASTITLFPVPRFLYEKKKHIFHMTVSMCQAVN